jgi:ribosomal protein S18 acetylase RimI-like enzyme
MKVQIRKAEASDIPVISLLARITFSETFGHYFRDPNDLQDYFERTFAVQKIQQSFAKPHNVFWIATSDDLPVGYAKLKLNQPLTQLNKTNTAQLQKIYVLKDFLSQKIGLQLQEKMLKEAAEYGNSSIWLSVLKQNERAKRFYTKNGFEFIGEHDFQIGKEAFEFDIMYKEL